MTVGRRIMFRFRLLNVCFATFLLLLSGCGVPFGGGDGVSPNVVINLSERYEGSRIVDKGDLVAVDMFEPVEAGYRIVGASFDPKTARLVSFVRDDDGKRPRVRYVFEVLDTGSTTLLFSMEPVAGGRVETYKRVTLTIKDD